MARLEHKRDRGLINRPLRPLLSSTAIKASFTPGGCDSSSLKESNLRPPHQYAYSRVIKRFEESGLPTGKDQTKKDQHMAIPPVNIKHIDNYFTADLSSIYTASYNFNLL